MVGWALLLAEWFTLAVYPGAFVQYFLAIIPGLTPLTQLLLKVVFIVFITVTNIYGVKTAGRANDILTILKVGPLFLLILLGLGFMGLHPASSAANFQPFLKGTLSNVGPALVLIFWAYAGFELSSLPADEVQNPKKTLPKALVLGMLIVTAFYVITSFVVLGVVDEKTLVASPAPLTVAASNVLNFSPSLAFIGGLILAVGALVSILGADESASLGTTRLAFAMSIDGLLPKAFSKLQKANRTPYIAVIVICSTAFIASVTNGISALINSSVFLLSFAYLATCISAVRLEKDYSKSRLSVWERIVVPVLGVIFSILLMISVNAQQILVASIMFVIGVPVFVFFAPKKELRDLKKEYLSRDATLERAYHQSEVFLANVVRHIKWRYYRTKHIQRALQVKEKR
jgi:amino acid transporter